MENNTPNCHTRIVVVDDSPDGSTRTALVSALRELDQDEVIALEDIHPRTLIVGASQVISMSALFLAATLELEAHIPEPILDVYSEDARSPGKRRGGKDYASPFSRIGRSAHRRK